MVSQSAASKDKIVDHAFLNIGALRKSLAKNRYFYKSQAISINTHLSEIFMIRKCYLPLPDFELVSMI